MTSKKLLWTAAAIAFPLGMAQAQAPSAAVDSGVSAPVTTSDTAATGEQGAPASDVAASGATSASQAAESATATDSAATTTTAQASTTSDQPVAVSKADVRTGATVRGSDGSAVGKIESVSADAAVVSTGKAKAQIPFTSFGKTDKGLVIAMSKSQFEAAASGKSAS
jgi:hypothetical protein